MQNTLQLRSELLHNRQKTEMFFGKEKVPGSNPGVGSTSSQEA